MGQQTTLAAVICLGTLQDLRAAVRSRSCSNKVGGEVDVSEGHFRNKHNEGKMTQGGKGPGKKTKRR